MTPDAFGQQATRPKPGRSPTTPWPCSWPSAVPTTLMSPTACWRWADARGAGDYGAAERQCYRRRGRDHGCLHGGAGGGGPPATGAVAGRRRTDRTDPRPPRRGSLHAERGGCRRRGPSRSRPPRHRIGVERVGIVCKYAGRFAEGEVAYRRALAIVESTSGQDSPEAATVWHNLGGLAFDAATTRRLSHGPAEPSTSAKRRWAPIIPTWQLTSPRWPPSWTPWAEPTKRSALYRRALAVFEHTEGADYDLAVLHNNLGVTAAQTGDKAAGAALCRRLGPEGALARSHASRRGGDVAEPSACSQAVATW